MADDDRSVFKNDASILLTAMGSAAFVVTLYHLITICLCNQNRSDQNSRRTPHHLNFDDGTPSWTENSVAHLIPAYKYKKKVDAGSDRDETCAVCLGEFEDGEELKTLPECMHSYHKSCIDMWLYSHSSCPVCRADATPSPANFPRRVPPDSACPSESNELYGTGVLQSVVVQST